MAAIIAINIDGVYLLQNEYIPSSTQYSITSSGLTIPNVFTWEYSGEGTFLGLSKTEGSSSPDSGFAVGDSGSAADAFDSSGPVQYYYSVAALPQSDLTVSYKGSTILRLSDSASKKLNTAGKYMEDDVEVVYTRPSGSGWETAPESWATGLVDRTISGSVYGSMVLMIAPYAFCRCSSLASVSFPACTTIGLSAFEYCTGLASVLFPACTFIGPNAFAYCNALSKASFPVCTIIESSAFYRCNALTSVSFPACTIIGSNAFYYCTALSSVSFPACTFFGSYAFYYCTALTSVSFPACTTIGQNAFASCNALSKASFPACITIESNAFAYCGSLASVSFSACTFIGVNAFAYCYSLASVSFPACTSIGAYVFTRCTALASASFPACTFIGSNAFYYCAVLSRIYFLASSRAALSNSNAFQSTPMQLSSYLGTFGSIYVPSSLVASYKAATNWTYYSARIVGV